MLQKFNTACHVLTKAYSIIQILGKSDLLRGSKGSYLNLVSLTCPHTESNMDLLDTSMVQIPTARCFYKKVSVYTIGPLLYSTTFDTYFWINVT